MKLTILGSGTFMPEKNRHSSSYLLEIGGLNFILDMGRGIIDQLLKMDFDLYKIDKVFLSHTHLDHIGEILSFIQFIIDNPDKKKFKNKVTEFYGPVGFKEAMETVIRGLQYDMHKNIGMIKFIDLSDRQIVKFGKVSIQSFYVRHSPIRECSSYRVECEKKVFCYSGDTSKCDDLIDACKNADVALVEADLEKKWNLGHVHMDGEDAGEIAQKAKVKKLVLTHIEEDYLKRVKKDAEKKFKGEVLIAKDLMEVKI